jgi:AcrR family transcriptional regulator
VTWTGLVLALVLALAGAGAAQAPETNLQEAGQEPVRERARSVLEDQVFQEVDALAQAAREDGLSPEPLWRKALEGAAKGVPADRLVPAVADYARGLATVRGLLGPDADAASLVAGVDALRRGVPATSLQDLGPGERSPVALVVLADLVESGVPAREAVGAVREAVERQAADDAILAMPAAVRRLMRAGRTPVDAVERVRRALRSRGRGGGGLDRMGPPVPPGSEPVTRGRGGG